MHHYPIIVTVEAKDQREAFAIAEWVIQQGIERLSKKGDETVIDRIHVATPDGTQATAF